jgi:16S rRNA (guanine966-N2)-methyltransferase
MLSGMRVIAGIHRGRRLYGPREQSLRPTSDRVREALFSILGSRLTNSRFLDLYAGTGAVGIEAVSRGAEHVTSVESNREALGLLQRNVKLCHIDHELTVRAQRVEQFLSCPDQWSGPYEIVFADPPYADTPELPTLLTGPKAECLFAVDAWLVIEHATRATLPTSIGSTTFRRRYRYGDTSLSVFSYSVTAVS